MKKRVNTVPRRHDLVMKKAKALSRKCFAILEDKVLDENCNPIEQMYAARFLLGLNNEMFYSESNQCTNG